MQLFDMLHDHSIIGDKKARECVAALYRYLNLRKGVPTEFDVQLHYIDTGMHAEAPTAAAASDSATA